MPPDYMVGKFNSLCGVRLQAEFDMSILSFAAGLLLIFVTVLDFAGDSLPKCHCRLADVDIDLMLCLKAVRKKLK